MVVGGGRGTGVFLEEMAARLTCGILVAMPGADGPLEWSLLPIARLVQSLGADIIVYSTRSLFGGLAGLMCGVLLAMGK